MIKEIFKRGGKRRTCGIGNGGGNTSKIDRFLIQRPKFVVSLLFEGGSELDCYVTPTNGYAS